MADEAHDPQDEDALMRRALQQRLPRHAPPPGLRASIVSAVTAEAPRRRSAVWWIAPVASAFAMAMIMILVIAPSLRTSGPTGDPVRLLAQGVISEYARAVFWGQTRQDVVPAMLPRAMEESGVALNWVFTGDATLRLVNAQATYLDGHRGIQLSYVDADGHTVTYIVVPARTMALPERGRVQIDRWRPLLHKENGFSLILWKQQDLLCVLMSDLVSEGDVGKLKDYFVKVRSSTEPYAVY